MRIPALEKPKPAIIKIEKTKNSSPANVSVLTQLGIESESRPLFRRNALHTRIMHQDNLFGPPAADEQSA